MQQKNGRHSQAEFPFFCLVMKQGHTQKGAYGSAAECGKEKSGFRDPVCLPDGFSFVDAHKKKGNEVCKDQIQKENLNNIFHRKTFHTVLSGSWKKTRSKLADPHGKVKKERNTDCICCSRRASCSSRIVLLLLFQGKSDTIKSSHRRETAGKICPFCTV